MTQYDLGQVVGSDGEDGNGIKSIAKTGTSGLVDTYTITFDDDTTTTFQVTNGKDGSDASVTIVTSWNSTTSDSKVPSEKLAKTSLDGKLDNALSSTVVSIASNDDILITDYSDSNKIKRVANILATQVKDSNAHSNIGSSANATQGTINSNIDTALSNKANSSSLSTVATSGSYSDLSNKPSIPSSSSDLSDGSSLVKTSSTTGLIKNDGSIDSNSYLTTGSASSTYQTKLVSGTSIKTINNESLLGSGNITIQGGSSVDVVTSWEATLSDTKVPSEKLTKNTIDGKLDNALSSTVVSIASNDDILITDYSDSNKIKRVANILASQVKDGTAHSNIGSSANDTQATINTDIDTALSNKVSKSSTTGLLKNDGTVDTSAYITSSAISGKEDTSNKVSSWSSTTNDTHYPTEKLVKDSLDSKQATLVSGTNIKTINNESLLGSGDIEIQGGSGGSCVSDFYIDSQTDEWVITTSACSQGEVVTSWSSTLTDTKVPSEKLVKEYVDGLVGDAITYIVGSGN